MNEQATVFLAALGPLSRGMAGHIFLMNLLAPIVALILARRSLHRLPGGLAMATAVQLALIWGWHAPPAWTAAMAWPSVHLAMQASLALAAFWFWSAMVRAAAGQEWRAILSLLLTSKLFCLLGVLLTFAARPIYGLAAHHGPAALDPLADQQLAGLMMLIACPLTYLVAAVVVAARWLGLLEKETKPIGRPGIV